MPHRPDLLIYALSLGSAAPVAAQQVGPAKPRTAAGASKFVQDMLTRGTAVAKPWPGFVRNSRITSVGVKGGCLVTLTLADKSALSVKLDQVVAIRPLYSANAPQASVEIKGGAQPYEGLDIYVGDNDAVRRVGDALEFMRQSCDPSAKTGF